MMSAEVDMGGKPHPREVRKRRAFSVATTSKLAGSIKACVAGTASRAAGDTGQHEMNAVGRSGSFGASR